MLIGVPGKIVVSLKKVWFILSVFAICIFRPLCPFSDGPKTDSWKRDKIADIDNETKPPICIITFLSFFKFTYTPLFHFQILNNFAKIKII